MEGFRSGYKLHISGGTVIINDTCQLEIPTIKPQRTDAEKHDMAGHVLELVES